MDFLPDGFCSSGLKTGEKEMKKKGDLTIISSNCGNTRAVNEQFKEILGAFKNSEQHVEVSEIFHVLKAIKNCPC